MAREEKPSSSKESQNRGLQVDLPPSYATYVDRWAIVVGISKYKYEHLNLKYADRDAEALHELLLTPSGGGFEKDHIVKLVNEEATTANITRALRSFLKKPAREDIVLIYFACHGAPDSDRPGIVYLLTHDTDPKDVSGTALPMREIDLSLKENLLAERVIILADTCHSAAIGGGIGRRDASDNSGVVNSYLREVSKTRGGVALLTSAEANEVSFEDAKWGDGHGVFTHYLLEGMKGAADRFPKNGIVTVGELFEYVRQNVQRATDNRQHPSVGSNSYDRNLPIAITAGISAQEHYELGCQLYQIGLKLDDRYCFESASRHLLEATRLARATGSRFSEAQLQLGLTSMAIGNTRQAIEALQTATQANISDAAYYLGMIYAKQGEAAKAVKALELFLTKQPDDEKVSSVEQVLAWLRNVPSSKHYALLIGINYSGKKIEFGNSRILSSLSSPENNIQLLGQILAEKYGFTVRTLFETKATYQGILDAFQDLQKQVKANDTVVVYYSGHVLSDLHHDLVDDHESYLLTYDISIEGNDSSDKNALGTISNSINAEELHELIIQIPAFYKTVILDATSNSRFLKLAKQFRDYTVFSSASPGEWPYEEKFGESRYGRFTYRLVQQLQIQENKTQGEIIAEINKEIDIKRPNTQTSILIGQSDEKVLQGKSFHHCLSLFDFSLRRNYNRFDLDVLDNFHQNILERIKTPFPELHYSFGIAFLEKENYSRALQALQLAIDQGKPLNFQILLDLSKTQFHLQRYLDCIETLQNPKIESSFICASNVKEIISKIEDAQSSQPHALLVGINNYLSSELSPVEGAVNDVLAIKDILLNRFSFQKQNIKVLLNNDATCKNILASFKDLTEKAKKLPAFFYFAGNGSLSESRELLTILGVDSRQTDVFDIEINELIQVVGKEPNNLVSCIDAGWTFEIDKKHRCRRSVPSDKRLMPGKRAMVMERDLSMFNLQIGSLSIYPRSVTDEVHTGQNFQLETVFKESSNQEEKIHGKLTHALVQSVREANIGTLTYKQLASLMSELNSEPFICGNNLEHKLFTNYALEKHILVLFKSIEEEPIRHIISTLNRLIEQRNGFDPEGHLNLGIAYYILKEYDRSITALQTAIDHVSKQNDATTEGRFASQRSYPEAHYWLGRVLYESKKDPARAVSELRLATQESPDNIAAHYYLGKALRDLVEQEILTEAERAYQTYLNAGSPLGQEEEVQAFLRSRRDAKSS